MEETVMKEKPFEDVSLSSKKKNFLTSLINVFLLTIASILSYFLIGNNIVSSHGDEIVIGDGNFPGSSLGPKVLRADGIGGEELLKAILTLIPLDTYSPANFFLMETTNGDPTPEIWNKYDICIDCRLTTLDNAIGFFSAFIKSETFNHFFTCIWLFL